MRIGQVAKSAGIGLSDISGYKVNELIGMDGLLLIAEESRELVMGNFLAEYEKPYVAIGIKKNGEKYPLRLAGKMIPYKGQEVRVVEFLDITEFYGKQIPYTSNELEGSRMK